MTLLAPYQPRYGTQHPEWVQNPVWDLAIKNNWTGYQLQQHFELKRPPRRACANPSFSAYREDEAGPFWSWERFGRTSTALADGRVIHIAGEHEDSYDRDFCIYNDVVVEYPGQRFEVYLYPKDVFPPTDFHTATLMGEDILLIGSLSYRDMRRIGETQVITLNTRTLTFSSVATVGQMPGWISGHRAEKLDEATILISGGKVETGEGYVDNQGLFELDCRTLTWRRRAYGDIAIFPVSADDYARFKSPAYGTANPECVNNPFWLAMAKRRWPPSRARLHFGDFAPSAPQTHVGPLPPMPDPLPEPGSKEFAEWMSAINIDMPKLTRTQDDVVWTALRCNPGRITLSDGRKLTVGGEINDFGEEYADPWIYNDIVVTGSAGDIAIYAYPASVFPLLWGWIVVPHDGGVLIFGSIARNQPSSGGGRFVGLSLDVKSFVITRLPVSAPSDFRLNLYPGCAVQQTNSVIFPNSRMTDDDPHLGIALDLDTLTWGEPFAHEHPPSEEDDLR